MEKKKRNKMLKAAGITVAALSALAVIAGVYVRSEARRMIGDEFEKMTGGRYLLSVGDVKVNPFRRSVTLTDLTVTPNDTPPAIKDTARDAHTSLFDFSAEQIFAAGIRFKNGLEIKKVRLRSPRIRVRKLQAPETPHDTDAKATPFRIGIGQLIISGGYAEFNDDDTPRNVIEGLELHTERLVVDTGGEVSGLPLGDNMTLTATRVKSMNGDGSMRVELDSIAVEMAAQTIQIGSFALIPTYPKDQFGRKSWKHKDWMQAQVSGISCHGVDFDHFIARRELLIDSVYLAEGSFSSYKNRNITREEWIKPLYHQLIQRLPVRFTVRESVIGSFDARYEELKAGGDAPGVVTFDRIGGRIEWLSNIPSPDHTRSQWRLNARLMGSGPLAVTVFMPVDSLDDRFEVAAILRKMDMKLLNGIVRPLAGIVIEGGTVDKLDFLIRGNASEASVDMTFLYSGLELVKLRNKKGDMVESRLVSEIINTIVLIDDNPRHGRIRRAYRTTERDPYRSPWNYLWRTVFAGVKETIGLGKF